MWIFLFLFYLVNDFVVVYFKVALVRQRPLSWQEERIHWNFGSYFVVPAHRRAVIYGILLAIISATLEGVFKAALYHYAKTGEVLSGFRLNDFQTAWQPKN